MQTPVEKLMMEVLTLLEDQLPYYYYYHSPEHTKYVIQKVDEIASHEGIGAAERKLLRIGALFHDIGFIHGSEDHEEVGCRIAEPYLRKKGYHNGDIKVIKSMIMATKVPQKPQSKLDAILADADLEYLGTEHFKPVSELLFKERKYFNPGLNKSEWNKIQRDFMEAHSYHTDFCKKHKEERKRANVRKYLK